MFGLRALPLMLAMCSLSTLARDYESPSPVREADLLAIKGILVLRHPELATSPGYLYTSFRPGIGEPGCDSRVGNEAKDTGRWVAVAGSSEEEIEIPLPTCSRPTADIYFAPFRETGARGAGAYARCQAPVSERDAPPPLNWTCDEVKFREYVQLEDQACPVTLIGELSDSQLRQFKEIGLSELAEAGQDGPESLTKMVVHPGGRAVAMFGDGNCRSGNTVPSVFFLADGASDPDASIKWRVVDADQWLESLEP